MHTHSMRVHGPNIAVQVACFSIGTSSGRGEIPQANQECHFATFLPQLFFFYHGSAVRTAGLADIQNILCQEQLRIKAAKDVRWLSYAHAISAPRRSFEAVLLNLDREATHRHEAQAVGLLTFCRSFKFLASVLQLSDALPALENLSKSFQRKDLDYSSIQPLVERTIAKIRSLQTHRVTSYPS